MFCVSKAGVTLVPAMAADALISALTIVSSTILVLATVMSVGKAPPSSFPKETESLANLSPSILALELMSAFTIVPFTRLALATEKSLGRAPYPNLAKVK